MQRPIVTRRGPCKSLALSLALAALAPLSTVLPLPQACAQAPGIDANMLLAADPQPNSASGQGGQADANDDALRDIKPLRPARPVVWPYVAAAAAAVLLLIVAAVWWWRRRKAQQQAAVLAQQRRPAHVLALEALQALHRVNFADKAAVRQYYFAISEVLRAYVTARFDLMATQLTTEEIFSRLPRLVELAPPENLRLRAFLAQTDQVKYALHQATPEEISATYEQAVAFIEATIRADVTPAAPDLAKAP